MLGRMEAGSERRVEAGSRRVPLEVRCAILSSGCFGCAMYWCIRVAIDNCRVVFVWDRYQWKLWWSLRRSVTSAVFAAFLPNNDVLSLLP